MNNEHRRGGDRSFSPPLSNGENGLDKDEVYELEFGGTTSLRPKPVAKPRRRIDRNRHGSAPGLEIVQNSSNPIKVKDTVIEVESHDQSHDQHPTPTRSAPAPPNAEAHSGDRVS